MNDAGISNNPKPQALGKSYEILRLTLEIQSKAGLAKFSSLYSGTHN
jgi:hypothetical protein